MRALMGRHNDKKERLAAKQLWSDVIICFCYELFVVWVAEKLDGEQKEEVAAAATCWAVRNKSHLSTMWERRVHSVI